MPDMPGTEPTGGRTEPAPIEPLLLSDCLLPGSDRRMLPGVAYTDRDVFAWEVEHLFRRGWVCVGRSEEVADARTQRAVALPLRAAGSEVTPGDDPDIGSILLVRGDDGVLRGFDNVCRHRGHELLPCGGTTARRAVVCPYHAWSYGLDGALIGAPGFSASTGFDRTPFGLVEVGVEEWHGWVFVDASGQAGPLTDRLGALDEIVARYSPATLTTAVRHSYRVEANWKVIIENYNECYHCSLIHPELCKVSPPRSGDSYVSSGTWTGGWMQLDADAGTMSFDGRSFGASVVPIAGVDGGHERRVGYVTLLPNVLISLHPDYVMTHRLTPLSPTTTRVECAWAFPAEARATPGFDPSYAVDFWDLTNRQDWTACESVQRGMASPRYRPGPLADEEAETGQFVEMIARAYLGAGLRIPSPAR